MNQFSLGLLALVPLIGVFSLIGTLHPAIALEVVPSLLTPSRVAQASSPEEAAEVFINQMAQQRFSAAVQDIFPSVQAGVTSQTLRQNWNDLVAESGEFQRIVRSQLISGGGVDEETVVLVTCEFANRNRDLFVILKGNEVASFSVAE